MDITQVAIPDTNYGAGRWFGKPDTIVIHSIVGGISQADGEFKNRSREASTNYAIDGTVIHQYVRETDTAYGCGVPAYKWVTSPEAALNNQRSIQLETAGGGQFGEATPETYRTTALLCVDIKRRNPSIKRIMGHREMPACATVCPSGMDMNKLRAMVAEIENGAVPTPPPPPTPPVAPGKPVPVFPMLVQITTPALNVRTQHNTSCAKAKPYAAVGEKGVEFLYDKNGNPITYTDADGSIVHRSRTVDIPEITVLDKEEGESVDGNSTWLKTVRGNYVWSGGTNYVDKYL